MKKNNLIQLIILFILGAAVLFSLLLPQLPHINNAKEIIQISMILRESDNSLWSNTRLGLEQASNELDAELRFLSLSKTDDFNEQVELVKREIDGGADAIIIVPVNPDKFSKWLENQKNTCPIICIESKVENADLTISPDWKLLGSALAKAARSEWNGDTICLIDNSGLRTGITARIDATEKALTKYNIPVKRLILSDNQILTNLPSLLLQNNSSTVITFKPYSTELAARCKEDKKLDFKLYGTGVSTYIASSMERGTINAIAAWSDYAVGYLAAQNAISLSRDKKASFDSLPFRIIYWEDMYETENEKLLFPVIS